MLEGEPTLFTDAGQTRLQPGMVAGLPASDTAHRLRRSSADGAYDRASR